MNPLLTPELGTYVWSLVIFMTVLFVLRKYAWNPLLDFLLLTLLAFFKGLSSIFSFLDLI